MIRRLVASVVILIGLGATLVRAAGGLSLGGTRAASSVKAELVADTTALAAGKPFLAAVTLTTNPGWHIYWSNPGDGGYATTFKWPAPTGYKIEPLAFPVPEGFTQPGDIHVIGYEGKTTFLFRITPALTPAPTTTSAKFSITADWLCCNKDQCVPGKATLELSLNTDVTAAAANKELFAEAMEHIPAATPPAGTSPNPPASTGKAEKWQLQIKWAKPLMSVDAFAPAVEGLDMSVNNVTTTQGLSTVDFKAHVYVGQQVKAEKIPLLIAYTAEDGKRRGFTLELDAAAIGVRPK